jgi:hypothetical protein
MVAMLIFMILAGLCMAIWALRGQAPHNPQEGFHSKEEELASHGVTWEDRTNEQQARELAEELQSARRIAGPTVT